jgi:hypothetical protein
LFLLVVEEQVPALILHHIFSKSGKVQYLGVIGMDKRLSNAGFLRKSSKLWRMRLSLVRATRPYERKAIDCYSLFLP